MKRNDVKNLKRICESCRRLNMHIKRFGDDYDIFLEDIGFQDAIIMQISRIGEHVKRLSDEFKENEPTMNWRGWIRARDFYAHNYYNIDFSLIWATIKEDIPILKEMCKGYLDQLNE